MINDGLQAHIIVSGHNLGDDASTWGPDGWMERAAQQFGYGNVSPYQRYTENLAYRLKQDRNADSVILCFFTHDDRGSIAIGPDQGYADKVLVSYFGPTFNSEPGSYEHEMVHAYGALDENNQGNGIACNYWPSGLAVSPMYEMYKNTNYVTCPISTKQGVMYYPYNSPSTPFWWQLSGASRKWIGWGDYDIDGILDPLDNTPFGNNAKIGVFLNGVWYLDFNGNGVWDGIPIDKQYTFGSPGVQAVAGDWNNDGRSELGVFLNGVWYLDFNGNGVWDGIPIDKQYTFGSPGVQAVAGDWNNDGRSELGVFLNGVWYLDFNGNGVWDGIPIDKQYTFGSPGVQAVAGDWNNDGRSELGVFLNGVWYLDFNGNGVWDGIPIDKQYTFGSPGVQAVTGDWNSDGRSELGVFLNGDWWLDYNGNGVWDGGDRQYTFEWSPGRIPVTGKWS